ncbi:MAG: hypothetical protein PVJ09_04295 [Candidatus Woesebacteria bacterium]|jgi:hypothetical protein
MGEQKGLDPQVVEFVSADYTGHPKYPLSKTTREVLKRSPEALGALKDFAKALAVGSSGRVARVEEKVAALIESRVGDAFDAFFTGEAAAAAMMDDETSLLYLMLNELVKVSKDELIAKEEGWPPEGIAQLAVLVTKHQAVLTELDESLTGKVFDPTKTADKVDIEEMEQRVKTFQKDSGADREKIFDLIANLAGISEMVREFHVGSIKEVESKREKLQTLEQTISLGENFLSQAEAVEVMFYKARAPFLYGPNFRTLFYRVKEHKDGTYEAATTGSKVIAFRERFKDWQNFHKLVEIDCSKKITEVALAEENPIGQIEHRALLALLDEAKPFVEVRKNQAFEWWKTNLETIHPPFKDFNKCLAEIEALKPIPKDHDEEDLEKKIKALEEHKGKVVTHVDKQVADGKMPSEDQDTRYKEHLAGIWEKVDDEAGRLQEFLDEKEKKRHEFFELASVRVAAEFFGGGFVEGLARDWKEEHPAKLAKGIFEYIVKVFILDEGVRDNKAFMSLNLMGEHLTGVPDEPTVGLLLRSFKSLGVLLEGEEVMFKGELADRRTVIEKLHEKLSHDIVQIELTFNRGRSVNELETKPDGLLSFYGEKKNQVDATDWARFVKLGLGYEDFEGGIPLAERLRRANMIWDAMHKPIFQDVGVFSDSTDEDPKFLTNFWVANPLTTYPLAGGDANRHFLQRELVRIIAGMDEAPAFMTISRDPGETMYAWNVRRMEILRENIRKILYETTEPLYGDGRASDGGLYNRWKRSGVPPNEREYLSADEKKYMFDGFLAEALIGNQKEYGLEIAAAEGAKLTGKTRTIDGLPFVEVDATHGQKAIIAVSRWFNPAMYSKKLIKERGGEGTHGPKLTLYEWLAFVTSQTQRYYYIPEEEREGVTLAEALACAETVEAFAGLPFSQIVTADKEHEPTAWFTVFEMAAKQWKRLTEGLGIRIKDITTSEPGSDGAIISYNAEIARLISKLARDCEYEQFRDWGTTTKTWDTDQDYEEFRTVEDWFLAQLETGVYPDKPDEINGVIVTDRLWEDVQEFSKLPTAFHRIYDIRKTSEVDKLEHARMTRWVTNRAMSLRFPGEKTKMNPFHAEVLNGTRADGNKVNDMAQVAKKVAVGNLLAGAMSVESAADYTYTDVVALAQVLSYDVFWKYRHNVLVEAVRGMGLISSRPPTYEYGLGYFTEKEAMALFEWVGIDTGIIAKAKEIIRKVKQHG